MPEDVEDIAAEVLLQIVNESYKVLRQFNGNSSLASYLVVIARRTCIHELNRRQSVKDSIRKGESRVSVEQSDDSEAATKGLEKLDEVEWLLKRLRGQEREIVRQYYLEGRTYEEISTEMNVPINTIGSILSRARKKLREFSQSYTDIPAVPKNSRT